MASSKSAITSLLTEHFRYTPLTLLDDIINTVNELVYRAVTAVEEGLSSAPPTSLGFADRAAAEKRTPERDEEGNELYPEARAEIDNGVHQLETLLEATVDKKFDTLELYVLRNILTVDEELAPWMKLTHYEGLELNPQPSAPTPESVFLLQRKVQETRKLQHALLVETSKNAALISQLHCLLRGSPSNNASQDIPKDQIEQTLTPSLSFLTYRASRHNPGTKNDNHGAYQASLTDQTTSAVSQIPQLCQLLDSLRPKIETLQTIPLPEVDERSNYIETQTKRLLQQHGVNMEIGEELLSPALDDEGRSIEENQVIAIERVVEALGVDPMNQPGQDVEMNG